MNYQQFIFKDWEFDPDSKELALHYSYDDSLNFTETYRFDFDYVEYDDRVLTRAIDNLFYMAGVSYYKAYLVPAIVDSRNKLDITHASFFEKVYRKGLGEFFYVNKLDPMTPIVFPSHDEHSEPIVASGTGALVGLVGGKDSLVSLSIMPEAETTTWTVGHQKQLQPLVDAISLPHIWVERIWDPKLSELNRSGAYNGHVPISAILACVGTVVSILSGKRDVVVSNEKSADEPTALYQGTHINHQYSKSSEFERDYQQLLEHDFGNSLRYYSLLRPYSELAIAERFAKECYQPFKTVFSSCNRAFTKASDRLFWCGQCPKCAFIFLILTPFIDRAELEQLFGKNLLLDPALEPTYRQLLGIEGIKPLECVGEVQESRTAMHTAYGVYPELSAKYDFEVEPGYHYRDVGNDLLPVDVKKLLPVDF